MTSAIHTLQDLVTLRQTPQVTTQLFPVTQDLKQSPFTDVQSGRSRTLMPTFKSLEEERQYRKEHLVLTFRALHRMGLAEGVAGQSVLSAVPSLADSRPLLYPRSH